MSARIKHRLIPRDQNHGIVRWVFETTAEFTAFDAVVASDIFKIAYVAQTQKFFSLRAHDPISWIDLTNATVQSGVYLPSQYLVVLSLTNGVNIPISGVGFPEINVADLVFKNAIGNSSCTLAFEAENIATSLELPVGDFRLANIPEWDDTLVYKPGDVRMVAERAYVAISHNGPDQFDNINWKELTVDGFATILTPVQNQLDRVNSWIAGSYNQIAAVAADAENAEFGIAVGPAASAQLQGQSALGSHAVTLTQQPAQVKIGGVQETATGLRYDKGNQGTSVNSFYEETVSDEVKQVTFSLPEFTMMFGTLFVTMHDKVANETHATKFTFCIKREAGTSISFVGTPSVDYDETDGTFATADVAISAEPSPAGLRVTCVGEEDRPLTFQGSAFFHISEV
jgi:hypothetical protein